MLIYVLKVIKLEIHTCTFNVYVNIYSLKECATTSFELEELISTD